MGSVPEFQAVVLAAGSGSRFLEITSQKTKCLLPVGNYPMIWYPLQMLYKNGIRDVIVVTHDFAKIEVAQVPEMFGGLEGMTLDVVCHPPNPENTDLGTAGALRLVHDRLKSPRIMIVSCDLVTDVQMYNLTHLHRVHDAAVTAFFFGSPNFKSIPVPGTKNKHKKERDLLGIDMSNNQLCLMASEADLPENLSIRKTILKEHPYVSVKTSLTDGHLYIFEKWICDYLLRDENIFSIRGELIPMLVKKQFAKQNQYNSLDDEDESQVIDDLELNDIFSFASAAEDKMNRHAQQLSSWNDHQGDMDNAYHDRLIRCYGYIADSGINHRLNNLHSYCNINRQISEIFASLTSKDPHFVHASAQVHPKAQIGQGCLVGDNSTINDKTIMKHSTVGNNCLVSEKVKLTNSIVMNDVTIKEGCHITGCLLCDGAVIPDGCELNNCIVGRGYVLVKSGKHSNETLVESRDKLMEI